MDSIVFLGILILIVIVAMPIAAFAMSLGARNRMREIAEQIERSLERLTQAENRLLEVKREIRELRESVRGSSSRTTGAAEELGGAAPPTAAVIQGEAVVAPPPPAAPPVPSPVPPPLPVAPPSAPGLDDLLAAKRREREVAAEKVAAAKRVADMASATAPPPLPPPPPPSQPPSPPPPPGPSRWSAIDWEGFVGVKLFSWIAAISLLLGTVYLLRYSIEKGWLSPAIRMSIGVAVGTGLLVLCELKSARRYGITANALDGAGIAILFSTFFASHALWHLLPMAVTFGLMILVTAVAVVLSIRRDSLFIALLGLVGGFATPALLSTGEDRPIGLFSYLLLLNAGLAWVGYRKNWPHLGVLSLIFTTLYQWGWVFKFLDQSKLPLAAGIFLIFPVVSAMALVVGSRGKSASRSSRFEKTTAVSGVLPLGFAIYMASVPAYGERYALLFGFLLAITVGLAAMTISRNQDAIHAGGAVSTVIAWAIWLSSSYTRDAWPGVIGFVAAFILLYLAVPVVARRLGRPLGTTGDGATLAAPILLFVFAGLAAAEPATASPGLFFGTLFVLLLILSAYALHQRRGSIYYIGAFFALAAEAAWSTKYLVPDRLLPALIVYAVFALFYLGVPMLGRYLNRPLEPAGTALAVLLGGIALLLFLAAGDVSGSSLWGLALLLAILNAGLFVEGSTSTHPRLVVAGTVLSWIIIGVWWSTAFLPIHLLPALAVISGFALLVVGGYIWIERKSGAAGVLSGRGVYLGLAGHLFLFFVAAQSSLAVPPWPMLAVMAFLDLAIGVAALYVRRGELHLGAMIASQCLLLVWLQVAHTGTWPAVAVFTAAAVALFGFAWFIMARQRHLTEATAAFGAAAIVAILLGQAVAITAVTLAPSLALEIIIPVHVAFIAGLLALTAITGWRVVAIIAIVPGAVAVSGWQALHAEPADWTGALLFASAIYIPMWAFPLVLGRRVEKHIEHYAAAVLAGLPFFFQARRAMLGGGLENVIGLLPVAQAALMAVLLSRLVRLEPPGERTQGRLALVAGAVLAFITVAIPLQLDKEWITIGWALQAAAIAWLYVRIPHRGLFWWSAGLFAAVFVRLVLNPAVLEYHARALTPIWNWYLYTYLVAAASFYYGARRLSITDDIINGIGPFSRLLYAAGTVLLFCLLNIEIADYYSQGPTLTFNFSAGLSQDLSYTIAWAVFAIGMLAAGIVWSSRATRAAAIILLVVTIVKCFLHDLMRLGGLYRVASLVGLAVCLALVAIVVQRFVLSPRKENA